MKTLEVVTEQLCLAIVFRQQSSYCHYHNAVLNFQFRLGIFPESLGISLDSACYMSVWASSSQLSLTSWLWCPVFHVHLPAPVFLPYLCSGLRIYIEGTFYWLWLRTWYVDFRSVLILHGSLVVLFSVSRTVTVHLHHLGSSWTPLSSLTVTYISSECRLPVYSWDDSHV